MWGVVLPVGENDVLRLQFLMHLIEEVLPYKLD